MLAHRIPPYCFSSNIVNVAKVFLRKSDVINQIPGVQFIHSCQCHISYLTKMLASNKLTRSPKCLGKNSDGTERRQREFQNNISRIAKEGGFKHVTLDSCILSVDETLEIVRCSILWSFQTVRQMLDRWRDLTSIMYPNWPDLLTRIPQAYKLTISMHSNSGCVMTDTNNAAM